MTRIKRHYVGVLLYVSSVLSAAEIPIPKIDNEKAILIIHNVITRMNHLLGENKFEVITIPERFTTATKYHDSYREAMLVVGGTKTGVELQILGQSLQNISFAHWAAFNKLYGKNATHFTKPPTPKFNNDEVICMAEKTYKAVVGESLRNVKLVEARFKTERDGDQFLSGSWYVIWGRINENGNEFDNDGVCVQISEQYGPLLIGINLASSYEDVKAKITKEEVEKSSKKYADEILACPVVQESLGGFELKEISVTNLRIVNPNNITALKSMKELAGAGSQKARLAWVVVWTAELPKKEPQSRGFVPTNAEIHVWISADTGEFLGGDFK
ncbi:MAG: hypothetical protein V1899_10330 [Planctomycetota bacterium]